MFDSRNGFVLFKNYFLGSVFYCFQGFFVYFLKKLERYNILMIFKTKNHS